MNNKRMGKTKKNTHNQPPTVTGRINAKALELLELHPEGIHWSELLATIKASDPNLHPKTINGCIWKLVDKYPDKVYKPSKGLFRLLKYASAKEQNRGRGLESLSLRQS